MRMRQTSFGSCVPWAAFTGRVNPAILSAPILHSEAGEFEPGAREVMTGQKKDKKLKIFQNPKRKSEPDAFSLVEFVRHSRCGCRGFPMPMQQLRLPSSSARRCLRSTVAFVSTSRLLGPLENGKKPGRSPTAHQKSIIDDMIANLS
jgi:hypothetical protein